MIYIKDLIKVGYRVELVYDVIGHTPFKLEEVDCDDCWIVRTDKGEIMLSGDTSIMLANGAYKRVDQLKPYTHMLQHVGGVAVLMNCFKAVSGPMVKVGDTDYVLVNGFTISPDVI